MKKTFDEDDGMLIGYLSMIPDPRLKRGVRYKLEHILLMAIYAVLAGYSDATEMEYYAQLNSEYFSSLLGIEHIPSHDTFSRIMRLVDFENLGGNIEQWIRDHFPQICEKVQGCRVLHVDGKALKAANEESAGEKPLYMMNAMYEGEGISLYLKKIGEKENEIGSLPAYLELFDLRNTIVTIDAIGCSKNVIARILKKSGHYLVPVKENQARLKAAIEQMIAQMEEDGSFAKLDTTEHMNKEHGRTEFTTMRIIKDTSYIYEQLGSGSIYGDIAKIGVMDKKTIRTEQGEEKVTRNRTILITDMESMTVENMLKIKQSHWNIEAQHWLLDVQLAEDMKRSRKGNGATNGAILRRFCLLMRKYVPEFENKPLNRFLMSNANDMKRIEEILFMKTQEGKC